MLLNWDEYQERFKQAAAQQGKSPEFIAACLAYAKRLAKADIPIIFDLRHLSGLLGFGESAIRAVIENPQAAYKTYSISKYNGGYRTIDEPADSLKRIQLWILRNILDKQPVHPAATAFTRGLSIRQNAIKHLDQPMVLSLDVQDFFTSLDVARVLGVFKRLGYSSEVSAAFASLTTFRNSLPQGAPTSPALSNLILIDFDQRLADFARSANINYTRYADDITFSGSFHAGQVISRCRGLLESVGLHLNDSKTRLMKGHNRQEVTGVVVNRKLQATRKLRRQLRQEYYYIKKFGIESHEARTRGLFSSRINHLRGLAEFVLFLNPDDRDARNLILLLGRIQYRRRQSE